MSGRCRMRFEEQIRVLGCGAIVRAEYIARYRSIVL